MLLYPELGSLPKSDLKCHYSDAPLSLSRSALTPSCVDTKGEQVMACLLT